MELTTHADVENLEDGPTKTKVVNEEVENEETAIARADVENLDDGPTKIKTTNEEVENEEREISDREISFGNDEVDAAVLEVRLRINPDVNSRISDADIQRFLRARSKKCDLAVDMIQKWALWRQTPLSEGRDLTPDSILCDWDDLNEETYRRLLPHSNIGHDREGRPVYFEKTGLISGRMPEILRLLTPDDIINRHVRQQEMMILRLRLASERAGRSIEKQVIVFDLKGLSYSLNTQAIGIFKRTIAIDQSFYPERLHLLVMINTPWFFQGIWALIKPFVDPVTVKKFLLLGADYIDTLRQYIIDDQIPPDFGGSAENFSWEDPSNWPEAAECRQYLQRP